MTRVASYLKSLMLLEFLQGMCTNDVAALAASQAG